jgi:microcystin-dependent protein
VLTGTGVISGSSTGAVVRVTRSNGAVTLGGALFVAGATSVSNTLTVSGTNATTLGGSLAVTGAAQFSGTLSVAIGQTTTLGTRVDAGAVTYATTPVGMISPYGGDTAPNGWVLCDGAAVSRSTYSALFTILGIKYGAGDGSTTFNVPDLRARVPFGFKSGDSDFGTTTSRNTGAGTSTTTLTTTQLPAHTHGVTITHTHGSGSVTGLDGTHNHSPTFSLADATTSGTIANLKAGSTSTGRFDAQMNTGAASSHTHTIPAISYTGTSTSDSTGSGSAFSNLPPYVVVNYIIKY